MDSLGRRAILLRTILIMTVGLLLCSVGFGHNQVNLLLISVVIYVAAYASAMGSVPWTCVEFLPLNRRSFGASCIACTNWLTNAFVSMTYLSTINTIGDENTMLIFAFSQFVPGFSYIFGIQKSKVCHWKRLEGFLIMELMFIMSFVPTIDELSSGIIMHWGGFQICFWYICP